MNAAPISATVLEDFLESIEHLPGEIQDGMAAIRQKEITFDDGRRKCHRLRYNYIKNLNVNNTNGNGNGNGAHSGISGNPLILDDQKINYLKEIENEFSQTMSAIDGKLSMTRDLKHSVDQYLTALDFEISKLESTTAGPMGELPYTTSSSATPGRPPTNPTASFGKPRTPLSSRK